MNTFFSAELTQIPSSPFPAARKWQLQLMATDFLLAGAKYTYRIKAGYY